MSHPVIKPLFSGDPGACGNTHTFVLRVWRAQEDQPWRASLRRGDGASVTHYASLLQLLNGLIDELNLPEASAPSPATRGVL